MIVNLYKATNSLEEWVYVIESKYLGLNNSEIFKILSITDELEKDKIEEAMSIIYSKKLGVNLDLILHPYDKLVEVIKTLNNGWYPNWEDANEYKYFNWFTMKGGFSFHHTYGYLTSTVVPSALCLKSRELAVEAKDKFIHLYKRVYL